MSKNFKKIDRENAELVLDWCKQNSYTAFYLKQHSELTNADMIAHRGKCHLLLLPSDENYPYYLRPIKQGNLLPTAVLA